MIRVSDIVHNWNYILMGESYRGRRKWWNATIYVESVNLQWLSDKQSEQLNSVSKHCAHTIYKVIQNTWQPCIFAMSKETIFVNSP